MACKKCGSNWTTPTGKDCNRCPHCDKLQLCIARQAGRWVEPITVKQCVCCGRNFDAVGPKQICQRVLCGDPECAKAHKKAGKERRASGVYVQQQVHGLNKPERFCKRCGKGPLRRDQRDYCSRGCAGADARECKRDFKGVSAKRRIALGIANFFYGWEKQRPKPRGKAKTYKPRPACDVCGKECNHRHAKCCSRDCKKKWRGPRSCKCGAIVEQATAFGIVYCAECKRKSRRQQRRMYGSYKRRCRTHGGYFNKDVKPVDVFRRDSWICHLCGIKAHKVFSVYDPLSATVDHYPIPLSKGGDHDWHNVRCACFECNSRQSNKTGFKLDKAGRVVVASG